MASFKTRVALNDPAGWLRSDHAIVDFDGVPGALGFYVAEAVDSDTILLHHRDGDQDPLPVETHLFSLEYRIACERGADPDSGILFEFLRDRLPPLCEVCGHVTAIGTCCVSCEDDLVDDLVRMAYPDDGHQ